MASREWDVVPEDFGSGTWRIDHDGRWYHDGIRVLRPDLILELTSHVHRTESGTYVLRGRQYETTLEVADTPAVIHRIDPPQPDSDACRAGLVDGRTTTVSAGGLHVGAAHVLYAALPDGMPARFDRTAYYQLARWIEEDGAGFALVVGERRWPIRGTPA